MSVDETGEQDAHGLTYSHDECEDQWPKDIDGVKYKELTDCRTDGKNCRIKCEIHMLKKEPQGREEGSSKKQGPNGEDARE